MGNDDEVKGSSSGGKKRAPRRTTRPTPPVPKEEQLPAEETGTELVARSRALFLRDVERQLGKRELYNLNEEFAATRKNRSPVVWLSVAVFVSILIVVAVLVTSYIQQRAQEVPVNIAAFEDVNLRDILDRAKQLGIQMDNAKRSLSDLQSSEEIDIATARSNAATQINLINTDQTTTADEKKQKIDALNAQLAAQIAQIRAQYAPKIADANQNIAAIQKNLDQYDARQVEQAKKQEAVLNNQQRVFDVQMQKTVSYYEDRIRQLNDQFNLQISTLKRDNADLVNTLKRNQAAETAQLIATYNPTFNTPDIQAILSRPVQTVSPSSLSDDYSSLLVQEGVVPARNFTDLQQRMSDFAGLLARLKQVPYKNSIPPTLDRLGVLNQYIAYSYGQIGNALAGVIANREQQIRDRDATIAAKTKLIDEYNHALSSLVRANRENGYVIDARDPSNILVFIDSIYRVKDGDLAYVFRQDDQKIATIHLKLADGSIAAQLVSLQKADVPMQPFDKILLDLKQ